MEEQNTDSYRAPLTKKERKQMRREERNKEKEARNKARKIKRLTLWLVVLSAVAGVVFAAVAFVAHTPENGEAPDLSVGNVAPGEWVKGNVAAQTTLIEYSDFQCPACGNYYPIVKRLVAEFGEGMRVVYRHFPLKQIHKNAEAAARAAEAAGMQGEFWDMHDMLFENQREWSDDGNAKDIFIDYAKELGLDVERFKKDVGSKEVKDAVSEDYNGGIRAGVNSTPTFILNGQKIRAPRTYEDFSSLVRKASR